MKIELSIFKVLCFTETWLSNAHSSSVYFPSNFNVYRCDRLNAERRSGGVAVLVHRSLKSKQMSLDFPVDPECEFLAVEVIVKPKPLLYYVCYMSTFDYQIASKHYQRIKIIMENYRNHRIIVLGDFNLHDITWTADDDDQNVFLPHVTVASVTNQRRSNYNENALDFLNKMIELPLCQMSNLRNTAQNVLDLLFVNASDDVVVSCDSFTIIEENQQDEFHIPFEIQIDYTEESTTTIEYTTIRCYATGNYNRMCQQLEAINFQHEFNMRNIDSTYEFFNNTIKSLVEVNVRTKTIKLYTNKPKWWSPELQRLKYRRDKLYKRKPKGVMTDEYAVFDDLNERRMITFLVYRKM